MKTASARLRFVWIALPAIALTSCERTPAPPAIPAAKPAAAVPAQPGVMIYSIDKAGLDALLMHLPGKVVLVDFWATWCPKCRDDFPHSVELSRKYEKEGLVVVSIACDAKDKIGEIVRFVEEQKATFKHLRAAHGDDEQTFTEFEIDGGALPHYKLFDRKGKLAKTFAIDPVADKQFTLADIDVAVVELLAAKPEAAVPLPAKDEDPPEKPADIEKP